MKHEYIPVYVSYLCVEAQLLQTIAIAITQKVKLSILTIVDYLFCPYNVLLPKVDSIQSSK